MNSGKLMVALAGVLVLGGIVYAFLHDTERTAKNAVVPETHEGITTSVVQVDDLVANPEQFSGDLVLRAVVSGVNEEKRIFGVIDAREFEECGVLSCAKNVVPVKHDGPLPKPKEVLQLTGRIVKGPDGLVFEARRLELAP